MQVREIMTADPAFCTPDSTLQEVARMMERNDCGCIPVVDSSAGMTPVGTITDRDIAIRAVAPGGDPAGVRASDVMTTQIATVTPGTSVEECLRVMEDRDIRRVLVVDDQGRCCGIVAQADVLRSGADPMRTSRTIREISESAPTRHQGTGYYGPASGSESVLGRGTLMPLLIGLGTGAAITLLLNSGGRASRGDHGRNLSAGLGSDVDRLVETANSEPIGIYPDAELEIERRRQQLGERVQSAASERGSLAGGGETSSGDEPFGNDKRRGAGQG